MVTISSGVVKTMIPEVNLSKISLQRMTFVLYKSYTYHSPNTKSFTSIDLSFCHPSLFLDYNWSVCEDQHNSDHFPIIIEQNTYSTEDHNPKWKLNRANWDLFNTLCTGKLVPENFKESSDPIADFTSSLIEISKECIPQTLTNPT